MFKFKLTDVGSGGEPVIVEADSRDILMWEKTTKGASFGDLGKTLRMSDLYRISYLAAKRLKVLPDGVVNEAQFAERFLVAVEADKDEGEDEETEVADPTLGGL